MLSPGGPLKLVVAVGGASGAPYARRLLDVLATQPADQVQTHVVFSKSAQMVWAQEVGTPEQACLLMRQNR